MEQDPYERIEPANIRRFIGKLVRVPILSDLPEWRVDTVGNTSVVVARESDPEEKCLVMAWNLFYPEAKKKEA